MGWWTLEKREPHEAAGRLESLCHLVRLEWGVLPGGVCFVGQSKSPGVSEMTASGTGDLMFLNIERCGTATQSTSRKVAVKAE